MANKFLLFLCISLFAFAQSALPGVRVGLSQQVFDEVAREATPKIIEEAKKTTNLPTVSSSSSLPVIGEFSYNMKNLRVNDIVVDATSIDLEEDKVVISFSGVSVVISLDWSFRKTSWPNVPQGSGKATIRISGSSIKTAASIQAVHGKPQLNIVYCRVSLQNVVAGISDTYFDWFYDFMIDTFKSAIKTKAEIALSDAISRTVVSQLDPILANINMNIHIMDSIYANFSITNDPITRDGYLSVPLKGEFYVNGQKPACELPHQEVQIAPPARMVEAKLDEYVFNSIACALFQAEYIDTVVQDSDLPSAIAFRLNTDSFDHIIPILHKHHPHSAIKLHIQASNAPIVGIRENSASVLMEMDVHSFVNVNNTNEWAKAFVLHIASSMNLQLRVVSSSVVGSASDLSMNLSVKSSEFGDFDVSSLQSFVQFIGEGVGLPKINGILSRGFALPSSSHFTGQNPFLALHDGVINVGTDVSFKTDIWDIVYKDE